MKKIILFLFISIQVMAMDHPIKLQLDKKSGDSYIMRVSVPKGYAIQKDAPNKIKLSSEDKIKINPTELTFKGNTILGKPEYFEKVEDNTLTLNGKGKLQVSAKIFYCDLNKNVCYPASIKQEETIQ
ncbi:MAG TPA: hypothetical protein PK079_07945 [Leptospiraceae bacterium]|nr:hypothetical protein [Leptospiraceae bacterium]HMW07382.1 hypothetical protein [Leptospiraceae bacterium]HMX34241.1 hypothetical protein [Leptospiraceae bacterium]HMY32446.1 hypothetical protein [Leptospiraceae bacterium]HMZ64201.1 hypothetical protein [Leptospiraceae bacterium]